MHNVDQALHDVKELYEKVVGKPAPDFEPVSYAPFPPGVDPVRHAMEEVATLKRFSQEAAVAPRAAAWVPHADTFATKDGFMIRLEIPGVPRNDLEVFVTGAECVVRGERRPPEGTAELRPLALETPWGPFERRFMLPPGCHTDEVKARCADGVLELRVAGDLGGIPGEMTVEVA